VSLIATSDAVLGAVSCIVERCLLVIAWGRLPTCRCGAVHDHLIVDGVLGDDVARLLEHAFEEAALFASPRAPFTVTGKDT
jgi:hypothetical protein